MAQVHKHAAAKRDLVEHFVYLAENAGLDTAERFMLKVEESFSDLGRHPSLGVQVELPGPEIAGMRKWHVKGFEKFLIFYRPRPTGVSVVRVIHATQEWRVATVNAVLTVGFSLESKPHPLRRG
jgi:toxin ParE1/3/4